MTSEIYNLFYNVVNNSLSTQQINYLGESADINFNLNRQSGFSSTIPVPRQTAVQTLLDYFTDDDQIINLFTIMLRYEGERFYNRDLLIWGKDKFIALLHKHKWIFDKEMSRFFMDPFYEHEINFLKKIRVLDLREEVPINDIIAKIADISKKMGIRNLEWRVALRLYDLDSKIGELIRKIISMLLSRQNLQMFTSDLYTCLKELAINATKANYKLLFAKHVTSPQGISTDKNYMEFLTKFRDEIEENGNSNLIKLAREDDRNINITFQSTNDAIEIWVVNNQSVTAIEKQQILKKLGVSVHTTDSFLSFDDDLTEGAGLGISLVLKVLRNYSHDKHPLKVIFYTDSLKIGFSLKRSELLAKKPEEPPAPPEA
jgi:hypothetical protein